MRLPRVRVSWLMLAVAAVALDIGAIRGFYDYAGTFGRTVVFATLPTANVLAAGALASRRHRRFVLGFLSFGVGAMASILAWEWAAHFAVFSPLESCLGLDYEGWGWVALTIIASSVLVVPQLAIALIGGILFAVVSADPKTTTVAK